VRIGGAKLGSALMSLLLILGCSGRSGSRSGGEGGTSTGGANGAGTEASGARSGESGKSGMGVGGTAMDGAGTGGTERGGDGGLAGASPRAGAAGAGGSAAEGGEASGGGGAVAPGRCESPELVTLVDGQAVISGDTSQAADEFPTLDCGGVGFAGPLVGPQLYYRFAARAGLKYEIRLESNDFDPDIFYVFPASAPCTVDAVQAACRSGGESGTASPSVVTRSNVFTPSSGGDYVIGVDTDGSSPGGPFTLRIFEYCASEMTDCKTQVCSALLPACDGELATSCNTDGTGYDDGGTDCTSDAASCVGGQCAASVSDAPAWSGAPWSSTKATDTNHTTVNFYSVGRSRTLTQIVQYMNQTSAVPLTWLVYEASSKDGPYEVILSELVDSRGSVGTESSGPIAVALSAGRYYAIGVGWSSAVDYSVSEEANPPGFPEPIFFGELISARSFDSAPAETTVSYAEPAGYAFPQYLTTTL
jgi:hypothetical protein